MKEKRMINSKLQHPPPYNPLAFWPWGAEFEPTNLEKFKHPVYCLRVEVGILYGIWTYDLPFGLLAQLVVYCTGIAEVMS